MVVQTRQREKMVNREEINNGQHEKVIYLCCIVMTVILSFCASHLYIQHNYQAGKIVDLQKNLEDIVTHIFPPFEVALEKKDNQRTNHLIKFNHRGEDANKIQEARKIIDILQTRVDFLEKINYDKFGRTDYASADLGGKVISVHSSERSFPLWNFIERGLRIGRFKMSNKHCCIIQNNCAGNSQVFYGSSALIVIKLMGKVLIDSIAVEHMLRGQISELSNQSALKNFSVWGTNSYSTKTKDFFFGNFNFDVTEDFLQIFNFTSRSSEPYEYLRISVLSNNGADYTCIYRIRVHGLLAF